MEEKTKKYSTVSYDSNYQDELTSICKDLKLSKGQFLELSVQYFTRTGLHPDNHLDDNRTQIAELRNTFISFTRTREKDLTNKLAELQTLVLDLKPESYVSELKVVESFEKMFSQQTTIINTLKEVLITLRNR